MKFQLVLVFSLITVIHSAYKCFKDTDKLIENSCFIFIDTPMNFMDAQQTCNRQHMWSILAKLESTTQANFLASYARVDFNSNHGNFWIGVFRTTVSDLFHTMDGYIAHYTRFSTENPSMNYAAESMSTGKWTTLSSEQRLPFICSYKAMNSSQHMQKSHWIQEIVERTRN